MHKEEKMVLSKSAISWPWLLALGSLTTSSQAQQRNPNSTRTAGSRRSHRAAEKVMTLLKFTPVHLHNGKSKSWSISGHKGDRVYEQELPEGPTTLKRDRSLQISLPLVWLGMETELGMPSLRQLVPPHPTLEPKRVETREWRPVPIQEIWPSCVTWKA